MRTIEEIIAAEMRRIAFIEGRDGANAAKVFAKQTYTAYRAQRKMRPMKYGQPYRVELIGSCMAFRQYLRTAK